MDKSRYSAPCHKYHPVLWFTMVFTTMNRAFKKALGAHHLLASKTIQNSATTSHTFCAWKAVHYYMWRAHSPTQQPWNVPPKSNQRKALLLKDTTALVELNVRSLTQRKN